MTSTLTSPSGAHACPVSEFRYEPPAAAHGARRILVKPNLGYPKGPPVTVGLPVLGAVLQGLRAVAPGAEILIVEGCCSAESVAQIAARRNLASLFDDGMQLLDADELPLVEYENRLPPVRFRTLWAPALLAEVDCRISVSAYKWTSLKETPLLSATLKNLYGLFPRSRYKARSPHSRGQLHRPSVPEVLQDVWGCIGHRFDGGVVDATWRFTSRDWRPDVGDGTALDRVVWGDDLLTVDAQVCTMAGDVPPDYLAAIARLRDALPET